MDAMTLVAKLILDKTEFENGLQDVENSAKGGNSGLTKWGVAAGNVAAEAFKTGFRTMSRWAKDTIVKGMDFDEMMSNVQAVSQMTADEYEEVRGAAIELGRTTKFTSTEVAQGLFYMGLAGWKTEDMLAGIPGVLNLAAASGEDLGRVSDIVTDAITAFGLTAEDSAHFVDVLAAASANSNTTVSQMGEAFKYLATTGGVLGYTVDDVAYTLGLLANNGIKAGQAGTTMRQVLNTLINPSEDAAKAMEALGLSLFDPRTDKRKPLAQFIGELQQVFREANFNLEGFEPAEIASNIEQINNWYDKEVKKLDSEDWSKNSYDYLRKELDEKYQDMLYAAGAPNEWLLSKIGSIGGLRGISSLFALMMADAEDIEKLSSAIEDSDGASQEMATTMLDNLKGDLTLLQSAMDGLQILVSDDFKGPLRDFVTTLTEEVGKLSEAFNEGGLAGMFTNLTDWIINGITDTLSNADFAEGAGKFGEALGDFVGHLVETLVSNGSALMGGLFNAGLNLAGGLVEGLFSGLFGTQEGSMKYFMDKTQDEQKKAIDEANRTATQAQGIVGYMDSLVQKYGEAAKSTEEWASAMQNLQTLMPGIADAMKQPTESLGEMVNNLSGYIEQMRELAVSEAQQASLQAYRERYAQALIDQAQNQYAYDQAQSQIETAQDTAYQILKQAYEKGGINRNLFEGNAEGYNLTDNNYRSAMNLPSSSEELFNAIEYLQGQGIDFGGWTVDGLVRAYEESQRTAENASAQMEDLQKGTEALGQELKIAEQAVASMTESGEETGLFGQENEFGQTESGTVDTSSLQGAVDSAASEIEGIDADLDTSSLQSSADSAASSVAAMGDSAANTDVSGYQAGLDSAGAALSSMAAGASIDTSGLQSAIAAAASALSGLASSASAVDFSGLSFGAIGGMTGPAPTINIPARHAKGAWDIPYDDYPALLHRGEMVLTASQARRYRAGSGEGIDPSTLYQAVASAVESAVAQIQINMDSMLVGNAVTKQVSKNIYREQYGRRYATL